MQSNKARRSLAARSHGACLFFVRTSLVGEKETCGQGTWIHFPGRVTKPALLDLQQGTHINVCEGSLGTVQSTERTQVCAATAGKSWQRLRVHPGFI